MRFENVADLPEQHRGESMRQMAPARKASKLGNVPTERDGIKFASKAEAKRYSELRTLERAGLIVDLALQPKYKLFDAFKDSFGRKHREAYYIGDFGYVQDGQTVCEDVKGHPTPVFRLKWKMVIRVYPTVRFEVVK